jgi:CRISPR/Cas system-associated protein Csx1
LRYIFQILGRLKGYQEVTYTINGFSHKALLSCEALSEYYKGECRIILLAPESIITHLTDSIEEAEALLRDKTRFIESVKQNIEKNRLLNKPFQVKCMQSSGFYCWSSSYALKFDNTLDNIISDQLIQLALIEDVDELILDISTGYNTQVLALLEAIRVLTVYHKLKHLLEGGGDLRVKMSTISPVTSQGEYPIDLYDFEAKAFFEFPIKGRESPKVTDLVLDAPDEFKRKLSLDFKWVNISKAVGEARRAFNAIKYNAPLTLFYDEIIGKEEDSKQCLKTLFDIINYVEEHRSIEVDGNLILSKRNKIGRRTLTDLLLTLALHSTLSQFRKELKRVEPIPKALHNIFIDLYEKIGLQLNARFLERDLADYEDKSDETIRSDPKRNFYAHSGLLENYVEEAEDTKKLAYRSECIEEIKEWLEKPER